MGADERQPSLAGEGAQRLDEGGVQTLGGVARLVEPGSVGAFGEPRRMLEDVAENLDEDRARHAARREPGGAVVPDPVPGDVDAPRHPDPVVTTDVVEEARQRRRPAGAADEPAMQADRDHLRRCLALGIEQVEGVLQIGEELVAGIEALRRSRSACRWHRACRE